MKRMLSAFAVALMVGSTMIVSATPSSAAQHHLRHHRQLRAYDAYGQAGYERAPRYESPSPGSFYNNYGPGQYDRLVNGSTASTPGGNN